MVWRFPSPDPSLVSPSALLSLPPLDTCTHPLSCPMSFWLATKTAGVTDADASGLGSHRPPLQLPARLALLPPSSVCPHVPSPHSPLTPASRLTRSKFSCWFPVLEEAVIADPERNVWNRSSSHQFLIAQTWKTVTCQLLTLPMMEAASVYFVHVYL